MAWSLRRVQNLMPNIVLADNRNIVEGNDDSLDVLGDDLSRVSRHIHPVNITEGSRLSSSHTSVNHHANPVGIFSPHKSHGASRRLIKDSIQFTWVDSCQGR